MTTVVVSTGWRSRCMMARPLRVLQQFFAQVGHVHTDDMAIVILVTPHMFEQLGTREPMPGMGSSPCVYAGLQRLRYLAHPHRS
jgi:hypothetical protein